MSGNWLDNLNFLAVSLRERGTPLLLSRWDLTGWTRGLSLPRGGRRVLYTGALYQTIPHTGILLRRRRHLKTLEKRLPRSLLLFLHRRFDLAALPARAVFPHSWHRLYWEPLRAAVRLLRRSGAEVGYLYERDLYPGTLAYELGLWEVFFRTALRVKRTLEESGVEAIITVDPHTTFMFRKVYPEVLPGGFPFEVKHYLEVLRDSGISGSRKPEEAGEYVLHEGCLWGRELKLTDFLVEFLEKVGFSVKQPDWSGLRVRCCGGPAEALFPERAGEMASRRLGELLAVGRRILTLCPICHLGFLRVGDERVQVKDLALALEENLKS
ncbi:(Fe-S)-binding protein [Thermosulfurimonas sp. F29]|uniref:(Fe-S)-binding protein n=1 Tax=Thermosulfurimonas sp. F29 TaxID=2867247 RepID=UPI001C82E5CA|nr:(Fe-S)-binding protein [Thermosulfurimonas sp. F29]MBX6422307.1 (Fe-S)-binding protein [Thermosulfurimonas sp. F29]